jgi:uncharacterized membrane protein YkoI
MKLHLPTSALLAVLAAAPVVVAQPQSDPGRDSLGAGWRQQQAEAREKVKSGAHVPLEQVVDTIRRHTPGRLLDAGLETEGDGRSVYRVRWASADGRRIDFMVDAGTGAILSGG